MLPKSNSQPFQSQPTPLLPQLKKGTLPFLLSGGVGHIHRRSSIQKRGRYPFYCPVVLATFTEGQAFRPTICEYLLSQGSRSESAILDAFISEGRYLELLTFFTVAARPDKTSRMASTSLSNFFFFLATHPSST